MKHKIVRGIHLRKVTDHNGNCLEVHWQLVIFSCISSATDSCKIL